METPNGCGQCLEPLEVFSTEAAQSVSKVLFHLQKKTETACYFSCVSICLFILKGYLYFECRLCSACMQGEQRERYCRCGWSLRVAPSPWGHASKVTLVLYTQCGGGGSRERKAPGPRPQRPSRSCTSATSHGGLPGRVTVPMSLCTLGWLLTVSLAELAEVWLHCPLLLAPVPRAR